MYRYDEFDHVFVRERVGEFRDQVERRISGALSEDEFRPLRLLICCASPFPTAYSRPASFVSLP